MNTGLFFNFQGMNTGLFFNFQGMNTGLFVHKRNERTEQKENASRQVEAF